MSQVRALLIGSTGMLGRAVRSKFLEKGFDFVESSRTQGIKFDAERDSVEDLLESASLSKDDYVVNCVGLTKAHMYERNPELVERAVRLNVLFPLALAREAEARNIRVIQVATDCVFSGKNGKYTESSHQDAYDLYGKSKSMGEVESQSVMHLRCSLIGPEGEGRQSLFFEWVRAAEPESQLYGYVNHRWNGLTSRAFARIVAGILEGDKFIPGPHHLVPADELTKYELIKLELELLAREDVQVEAFQAEEYIDRTLATNAPEINRTLFAFGGYERVPTIREMMEELPWEALRER